MSVKHIGLVLDHLDVKPSTKLVAIVLADHADSDGLCWPSYRRIADRTGLDSRSVRRHVSKLLELGVVKKIRTGSVVKSNGVAYRVTNAYRLNAVALARMPSLLSAPPKLSPGDLGMEDTVVHLQVDTGDRHRRVPLSTKPSRNHQANRNNVETGDNSDREPLGLGDILAAILPAEEAS